MMLSPPSNIFFKIGQGRNYHIVLRFQFGFEIGKINFKVLIFFLKCAYLFRVFPYIVFRLIVPGFYYACSERGGGDGKNDHGNSSRPETHNFLIGGYGFQFRPLRIDSQSWYSRLATWLNYLLLKVDQFDPEPYPGPPVSAPV